MLLRGSDQFRPVLEPPEYADLLRFRDVGSGAGEYWGLTRVRIRKRSRWVSVSIPPLLFERSYRRSRSAVQGPIHRTQHLQLMVL